MALSSMARIASVCLACSAAAAEVSAQELPSGYIAPPPIALRVAPAPELPSLEYPRRPFELAASVVLAIPSCGEGSSTSERCDGIALGPGGGATLLWRPSPYFAVGGSAEALGFGFRPAPSSSLQGNGASGHFVGALGRVYFFDHGWFEPYVELGFGSAAMATSARELDAQYDETSAGLAMRAGGALEFYLGRQVRLGPAFDWTTFNVQHVRRCAGSRCVDLDPGTHAHGNGFSSIGVRLTILLGPGL